MKTKLIIGSVTVLVAGAFVVLTTKHAGIAPAASFSSAAQPADGNDTGRTPGQNQSSDSSQEAAVPQTLPAASAAGSEQIDADLNGADQGMAELDNNINAANQSPSDDGGN